MIRIEKGGDIKFPVNSVAGLGQKYKIYFYTKRPDVNVSKTDLDVVEATEPYIPLPWSDLAMIGEGVMNLTVNNMTPDMSYDDGVYDNTFTRTTNYYIVNEGGDVPGSLEERVDALETGLADEVERSITFDDNMTMLFNTLSDDLEQEEAVREAADTALQNNLNTLNDGLNETIVQLTNEITNRQQADNQLSMSITSEAQQRNIADGNLQTQIDANASAISNIEDELELYALKADVYNKSQIDSKVTEIYGSIGSEESSRIAGDENLQSQINQKANTNDVYTKTAVDTLLSNKADKSTTYTKTEVDSALASKANSADVYGKNEVYTKSETDAAINAHTPDLSNYYTKSQTDTLLNGKADEATTLAGYGITDAYTKSETDTAISTAIAGIDLSSYETIADHDADMALKADKATTYTKTEVDTALSAKADSADVYTKTQIDTTLSSYETTSAHSADMALKADKATTYTKTEVDTALGNYYDKSVIDANELVTASALNDLNDNKADKSTTYTKSEVDHAIDDAISDIDLSNYYTKSETYNINEIDAMEQSLNGEIDAVSATLDDLIETVEDNELVTASAISDLQDADAVLAGANASMDARVTVLESSIPDMSNYYTKSEVDTELADKADEATTLAGYGITDAYTKTEVDAMIGNINTILASI